MNRLYRLIAIFLIFLTFTIIISPKDKNLNIDNSLELGKVEKIHYSSEVPDDKKIMNPVVKLYQIAFPEPEIISMVGAATGFSIKYDRKLNKTYILTNHHFCENKTEYDIGYFYVESDNITGGNSIDPEKYLSLVYTDERKDLCILKTYGKIKPVKFGNYKKPLNRLDKVYVVGAPRGIFPIVTENYYSGIIHREQLFPSTMGNNGFNYLLISGIVHEGHSGSPIYNKDGELVGIIFARYSAGYGGFGIGLKDIVDFIGESGI